MVNDFKEIDKKYNQEIDELYLTILEKENKTLFQENKQLKHHLVCYQVILMVIFILIILKKLI